MLKIKIPKQYKNAIIYQDGKYVVYDESQAHSLGEFDELWEAILCLERYINNYLQWTKEFEDTLVYNNDTGHNDEGFWEWHELETHDLKELFEKYLKRSISVYSRCKVKIKVRNGAILIERVEE